MLLGCVCFGWKWFQEIIFTLFRMFGCHRKWYFPENDFRLTNIFTFDPEMIFSPHFHFKAFPEKERERGRARARERGEETEQSVDLQAAPISSLSSRQRDLAKIAISRRSRSRAVASSRLRSRSTRAVARSRSQIDREIAPSRARTVDREIAISDHDRWWYFSWVCVFLLLFQTPKNILPENFLKCNQTQRNIFLFQKLAFPENMYFPENVLRQPNTALEHILLNHFRKILSRIEKVVKIFNNFFNFWLKKILK